MTTATLVRVTTDIIGAGGERAWALWIVVTGDPKAAEKAVRERVPASFEVEATDTPVLPETVERLGLAPG